jgi:NDP-sugar pyrophosphorylase family protein
MDLNIDVVILAGGFGTRLKSRLGDLPKPMVKLLDKPALEWQIILCKKFGFKVFYLLVHYNYESIINYFGDGSKWGVKIEYVIENEPRGTAGSLSDALNQLSNQFIVLYGDTYIDVDLIKMLNYHNNINSEITLLVHPNSHPNDSDLVELDENNKVKFIHSYPHNNNQYHKNLVNAALYIINKSVLKGKISKYGKSDLAKDIFPILINMYGLI